MINAINTLQTSTYASNKASRGGRSSIRQTSLSSKRQMIRHTPPAKNRNEILAKLREKGIGKPKVSELKDPIDSPLMDSEKAEQTKEKLKTVLSKGGFNFSERERQVLSKLVK